mgnify:CR=1 FL=1
MFELFVHFTHAITPNGTYLVLCLIGLTAYGIVVAALVKNSHTLTHTFYVLVWHLAVADIMYLITDLILVVPASFANGLPFGKYWTNLIANLDTLCWNTICLLMGEFYRH